MANVKKGQTVRFAAVEETLERMEARLLEETTESVSA
jgi:hypothetical protein